MSKLKLDIGDTARIKHVGKGVFGVKSLEGTVVAKDWQPDIRGMFITVDCRGRQMVFAGDDNLVIGSLREWRLAGRSVHDSAAIAQPSTATNNKDESE